MRLLFLCIALFLLKTWDCHVSAGGFVVIESKKKVECAHCPGIVKYTLPLSQFSIQADIENEQATTNISQQFINPIKKRCAGRYYFPVNVSQEKYPAFFVDEQVVVPVRSSVEESKAMLKQLVIDQGDPSLLTYWGQALYHFPIENLGEDDSVTVKIKYKEELQKEGESWIYEVPIDVYAQNRLSVGETLVDIKITNDQLLTNIFSPTFPVASFRKNGHEGIVEMNSNGFSPKDNFKLFITTADEDLSTSVLGYESPKDSLGFFYINVTPALELKRLSVMDKDITFILDCSGSMKGNKIKQAKDALIFCLQNLNKGDRFNVINFSERAHSIFDNLVRADSANVYQAIVYVNEMIPSGSTNVSAALNKAFLSKHNPTRPAMIVFIADGKPTAGITKVNDLLSKIKEENHNDTKIFTFGIGDDLNARLLDSMAEITGGYCSYISSWEDISLRIRQFYRKVSSPILTDVSISFINGKEVSAYPSELEDLSLGNPLMIYGTYKNEQPTRLLIRGKFKGIPQEFDFPIEIKPSASNDYLAQLWASKRVGSLLVKMKQEGVNQADKNEIAKLSRAHGLLTPLTIHLLEETRLTPVNRQYLTSDLLIKNKRLFQQMLKTEEGATGVLSSRMLNQFVSAPSTGINTDFFQKYNTSILEEEAVDMAQQSKWIKGQVFYNTSTGWEQDDLKMDGKEVITITFASDAYFELLNQLPETKHFLALGVPTTFVFEGKQYEVVQE